MVFTGTCPRCKTKIPEDRMFNGLIICECGWNHSKSEAYQVHRNENQAISSIIVGYFLVAVLIAGSLYLSTTQGKIMSLRTQAQMGVATQDNFVTLSQLCKQTGDLLCAESSLEQAFNKDKSHIEILLNLAKLQEQTLQNEKALNTYQHYFSLGGNDQNALLKYAFALERTNQYDKAIEQYEKLIIAQAGSINITATKGLINLYIKLERYQNAEKAINEFKKNTELDEFKQEQALLKAALRKNTI